MDDTTPGPPGVVEGHGLRDRISAHLEDLLTELIEFTDELRAYKKAVRDDPSTAPEAEKHVKGVTRLMTSLRDQEGKANEYSDKRAGPAGEFALDLGLARTEIGQRLARIREAGRTEGVPGQPEG